MPHPALFGKVEIDNMMTDNDYDAIQGKIPDTEGPYVYENKELRHVYSAVTLPKDPELQIRMEDEYYSIEVVFEVSDTEHNYEKGNLYIQCQFNSFKKNQPTLTVARQGFLDPKGSMTRYLREFLSMIPLSGYLFHVEKSQVLGIKVFERFDNKDFGLESVEFLLSNETLQFRKANLRVTTTLQGFKWLIHEWFFTCLFLTVFSLTSVCCFGFLLFVLMLKRGDCLVWL